MPVVPDKRSTITFGGNNYMLAQAGPVDPSAGGLRPSYDERRVRFAASRTSFEAQGYKNWSPEEEFPWQVGTYTKGYGPHVWEPGTYHYGLNVDPRVPNELKLAPEVNSASLTGEDRIRDVFTRSISGTDTLFACMGRYVRYWTTPSSPDNSSKDFGTGTIQQGAATFQGTHDTALTYVASSIATGGMPQPFWTFSGSSNTGTWVADDQVTDVAPSSCKFYDHSGTSYTTDAAAAITMTLSSMTSSDYLYIGGTQPFESFKLDMNAVNSNSATMTVQYYNGSSWTSLTVTDGSASGGATMAQDGNVTYTLPTNWQIVDVDGTTAYWVRVSVTATLDSSVTTTDIFLLQRDTATHFAVLGPRLYRVYKSAAGFKLAQSSNGTTGPTWVELGTISSLDDPVTEMYKSQGRLHIWCEQSFHVLESDGETLAENVFPHGVGLSDSLNAVGASNWGGNAYVPLRQGLYRIFSDQGVLFLDADFGPQRLTSNDSPVRGRVTAVTGDDFHLYSIVQDEDGKSYLICFVPDQDAWHTIADLGSITSRRMWVSDVGHATNPLLYFSAGTNIRWLILPRSSPNPLHDSACRYASSGTFFPGQFFADFSREVKAWLSWHLVAERLDTGQTVKHSYRVTDDGSFSDLVTYSTDPGGQQPFATNVASRMIDTRLTLATTDSSKTPVVRLNQTRYAVRFPYKRRIQFAVRIEDYQSTLTGRRSESAQTLESRIRSSCSSSAPVTLSNPFGESIDVVPIDGRLFLVKDEVGRAVEWAFFVEAVEHQATVLGTHAGLSSFVHSRLAAFTHQQLADGDAA